MTTTFEPDKEYEPGEMFRVPNEGEIVHTAKSFDRFEWTVNFFFEMGVVSTIESPGFLHDQVVWKLAVGSRGKSAPYNVFLNVWRTERGSGHRYLVRAGFKNRKGRDFGLISCETDTDGFLELRNFWMWDGVAPSFDDKQFPGGRLTIFCEICRSRKGKELAEASTKLLKENLNDLFVSGENSDVEIKVDNRTFKVHKAILTARCSVFAKMFQHNMQENNSGTVDIPDCSADAFSIFLHYLYTGELGKCVSEQMCNLYYIADKYSVQELKEHCVGLMKISISVDNFCEIISISLLHGNSELLQIACSFFIQNVKHIIKTVQWQEYLKENPIHANELFIKASNAF